MREVPSSALGKEWADQLVEAFRLSLGDSSKLVWVLEEYGVAYQLPEMLRNPIVRARLLKAYRIHDKKIPISDSSETQAEVGTYGVIVSVILNAVFRYLTDSGDPDKRDQLIRELQKIIKEEEQRQ